jgi:HAD superfamily hydrolase (TIGR01509 family)
MQGEARQHVTQTNGRAVLWDLDGTILDSREGHWISWRAYTEGLGKPVSREFFIDTFGFRNEIILRLHFGEHLTDEEVIRMSTEKETLYRNIMLQGRIEALPGVREWLETFRAEGWRQALGSMAPHDNIAVTLGALGIRSYFDAIVGSEDVPRGKPDPAVFLLAAARVGVPPGRCIVIEDSAQGVEAAQRAGMKRIAVGPESASLGADLALPSLAAASARVAAELLESDGATGQAR